MIQETQLKSIGKFQRTHALKGELNALIYVDETYISDGNPLIVEIDGCFVPFYADGFRPKSTESCLIHLDGIETVEDAAVFVNKIIYAREDLLESYMDDSDGLLLEDLIDYSIDDIHEGSLGRIADIDESTANPLFIVETPDGGELILPANDDLIEEIDTDKHMIIVNMPLGLINLDEAESDAD